MAGMFLIVNPYALSDAPPASDAVNTAIIEKFDEIWNKVLPEFIRPIPDTPEAKWTCFLRFLQGGLSSCLEDPYAAYYDPEKMQELTKKKYGVYDGIGLLFEIFQNHMMVIGIIEGSPADRSGKFRPGDMIITIDGENVEGKTNAYITNRLQGEIGTTIVIQVKRDQTVLEPVTLIRETIEVPSVYTENIQDDIAYVRISGFWENTPGQFFSKVSQYIVKSVEGSTSVFRIVPPPAFIFDLRDNPGGLLESVKMIAYLLSKDYEDLIVTLASRHGEEMVRIKDIRANIPTENYFDPGLLYFPCTPYTCIVLVNENTASGAEIFALLMKDLKGATLIGKPTFGKGNVQTIYELKHKDGIRFTIYQYYVGNRKISVRGGIQPDLIIQDNSERVRGIGKIDLENDLQLAAAVKMIRATKKK